MQLSRQLFVIMHLCGPEHQVLVRPGNVFTSITAAVSNYTWNTGCCYWNVCPPADLHKKLLSGSSLRENFTREVSLDKEDTKIPTQRLRLHW